MDVLLRPQAVAPVAVAIAVKSFLTAAAAQRPEANLDMKLVPGVGFEPTRPRRDNGF
jgi:hypothetical protein